MPEKIDGLRIAYIGGGSRGWAWGFMTDLAMDSQMEGVVRLYDIDRDAAEKNAVIGGMTAEHPKAQAHWRYEVSDTLPEALEGADFIVISILPATFHEMQSDVHAPEKYGVYQSVGDSIGPGGFMRAMRTIPMYIEIAHAIERYAPSAWIINYTNPMSVCVRTLYAAFPGAKAFGCCHEVFGTQKLLASMVSENLGIADIPRQDIHTGVIGINHFTWLNEASYKNIDLFPMYKRFVDKYCENGYSRNADDNWMNSMFACNHRVKFDLFLRYGLIAAAGDRHLAEFMPPAWYLRDAETSHRWGFTLTPVSWREEDLLRRLERRAKLLAGEVSLDMKTTGEEGHLLLKALLGLGDMVSNVNIPNRGQVKNLPLGAVVETNALFRRDSISPVGAGSLPAGLDALVLRHAANQENTVRAAMEGDRKLALAVFQNDPQLGALDACQSETLFDEMLEAQRSYVPEGLLD